MSTNPFNNALGFSSTCEFIAPPATPLPGNLLAGATFDLTNSNGNGLSDTELESAFDVMTNDNIAIAFDMDSFPGSQPLFAFSPIASQTGTMRIDVLGGVLAEWESKHFAVIFDDSGSDHVEAINPSDCTGSGSVLSITVSEVSGPFKAFQFTNPDALYGPAVAEVKAYNMVSVKSCS